MQEPKVQFGVSDSADFEENTWAFSMDGNYRAQAGRHAIMTENEFQRLLEASKENLRLQEVAKENVRLRSELHAAKIAVVYGSDDNCFFSDGVIRDFGQNRSVKLLDGKSALYSVQPLKCEPFACGLRIVGTIHRD